MGLARFRTAQAATAALFASVAPLTKLIRPGRVPSRRATPSRAASIRSCAFRPVAWTLEALPQPSSESQRSKASRAQGRSGDVAL